VEYNNRLFNELKAVEETLEERYTSSQLIGTLDDMLYRSIRVIVRTSTVMDEFVSTLLSWYSSMSRRKITRFNKADTLLMLAQYLISDYKGKMRLLRKLGIERNLLFYAVNLYVSTAEKYAKLEYKLTVTKSTRRRNLIRVELDQLARSIGASDTLGYHFYEVKAWADQSAAFRNQILEKYVRHALNRANVYYRSNKELADRTDLSDLIQNFLIGVNKAISKFDSEKGALTPYINHWLRDAQVSSNFEHEWGVAYAMPSSAKRHLTRKGKSVNVYVSIDKHTRDSGDDDAPSGESKIARVLADTQSPDKVNEQMSEIERIRLLAKYADPIGLARMKLGIEEVLTHRELSLLKTKQVNQ